MTPVRGPCGLDRSSGFTAAACGGNTRLSARFVIANGQALPVRTASFDRAVSALVLNFVASPTTMIAEMARAVRTAGMVGVYVWDYAGAMQLIRHFWDTAAELDPDAAALDEAGRFPICTPGNLEDLFSGEGLRDVDVRAIDVPTVFRDFDDYWSPFLGGQGPAPGHVASLGDDTRRELRDALRARMPYEADGSIRLVASPGAKW